ncbi:hypothetical protein [Acetobacter cibinongensis]|uniref:hypothetical protein n=1 Tax=Acetobacter cibinongensis TaxID=146475 RepID=UPI001F0A875F|nr:hypothetical protein [Acetobacter cibinongensis]
MAARQPRRNYGYRLITPLLGPTGLLPRTQAGQEQTPYTARCACRFCHDLVTLASSLFCSIVHMKELRQKRMTAVQDQDHNTPEENEVVVGYLVQRETADGDVSFWEPRNEWQEDPNEGKLYENEEEANADAKSLQEGDDATITVEIVFEADEDEEWDDEEEEA